MHASKRIEFTIDRWSDFVFNNAYLLISIQDLEGYFKKLKLNKEILQIENTKL